VSRYVAALVALMVVSLMGFVANRISGSSKSQIYLPTAEERVLLAKRSERMREEHEQRRAQGHRLEPQPPSKRPEPPASA